MFDYFTQKYDNNTKLPNLRDFNTPHHKLNNQNSLTKD